MAKVTDPSDTFGAFQTFGKSITLRSRKEGFTVSRTGRPTLISPEAVELIEETAEAKLDEWRGFTEEQKQGYDELGEESFQSGIDVFFREAWKSQLQGRYGVARYGQNVYLKGF